MFIEIIEEVIGCHDGLQITVHPEHFDWESDYVVRITWLLPDDSDRTSKRSKNLIITIKEDAVEDIRDASEQIKSDAAIKLREILEGRMAQFDPNHDAIRDEANPVESWDIQAADLF